MEEQNRFFKKEQERKEKEKQKEGVPTKFKPKGPVKILQRQRYASTIIPGQTPRKTSDSRYSQSQHNYWATEYEGTRYGKEFGQGITLKRRNGPKGMDVERDIVLERKKRQVNPISQMELRVKLIILPKDQERMVGILQQRVLVMHKVGMGEMRVGMIRRGLGIPNMTLRMKGKKRVIQKILIN